jgi:hypothetical protein
MFNPQIGDGVGEVKTCSAAFLGSGCVAPGPAAGWAEATTFSWVTRRTKSSPVLLAALDKTKFANFVG